MAIRLVGKSTPPPLLPDAHLNNISSARWSFYYPARSRLYAYIHVAAVLCIFCCVYTCRGADSINLIITLDLIFFAGTLEGERGNCAGGLSGLESRRNYIGRDGYEGGS